jgi:hypothetical protein
MVFVNMVIVLALVAIVAIVTVAAITATHPSAAVPTVYHHLHSSLPTPPPLRRRLHRHQTLRNDKVPPPPSTLHLSIRACGIVNHVFFSDWRTVDLFQIDAGRAGIEFRTIYRLFKALIVSS